MDILCRKFGAEILWKGTVSAEFWTICPKLCGNCAFLQNFHNRKSGEIAVFYAVKVSPYTSSYCKDGLALK